MTAFSIFTSPRITARINWINLTLEGTVANRSAIGARVKAKATISGLETWQMREISGGSTGQNSLRVHFGSGDAETVDSLVVHWPGSITETYTSIPVNKFYRVVEGNGMSIIEGLPTDVDAAVTPADFSLSQNYPNPFNPSTTIEFTLLKTASVTLKVFDISGKEVAALIDNEVLASGKHKRIFDASHLANGVYLYHMRTDAASIGSSQVFVRTRKLILLK